MNYCPHNEKSIDGYQNILYLCVCISSAESRYGVTWRGCRHNTRAFIKRLFLTIRNLATSLIVVRNEATIGAFRSMIYLYQSV